MTKAELVNKMAEDAGITKVAAGIALDSFFNSVGEVLRTDERLTIVGFGTFYVSRQAARKGRNPFNGEPLKIKARKVARFRAGKELLEKL
jgi:DNA-binding protein HU-beta